MRVSTLSERRRSQRVIRQLLMKFRDRFEAGQRLARILKPRNLREAVVLSLPRGGVKVGFEIAQALSLPHDIVSIRKIGHPGNPEFAACAIDEVGVFICDESSGVSTESDWFKAESQRQREEAHRRSVVSTRSCRARYQGQDGYSG